MASLQGGNRDQSFAEEADGYALGRALRLSWRQKVSGGFFLRAETFFNFATYLEEVGGPFIAYGGKSLHEHELTVKKIAQFVIATHSPMLLTFPGATIFGLDAAQIRRITYQETDHFKITRDFLNAPERYYRHLLEGEDE